MFHDLNVPASLHARHGDGALWEVARLGYDVVAFATTVKGKILRLERRQPTGGNLLQLTRVTVEVNDTADLTNLASPILAQYDIVAVRPATEKLLQQCMQFDFDILSLDLSARMPFFVKRPQSHVAAEKGVAFEIAYAGALCDGTPRHFLISNAVALVRALRGRNIVLTSAAASLLHLRGPYDVINLALLFNLDLQQARDAVVGTPAAVVQHACSRRTHKGFAYIAP